MVRLNDSSNCEEHLPGLSNEWNIIKSIISNQETNSLNLRSGLEQIPIPIDQYLKSLEWIDQHIFSLIWPDKSGAIKLRNIPEVESYKQKSIKCFQNTSIHTKYPAMLQRVRCLILASENKFKKESFKELLPLLTYISNRGIEGQDRDDIYALHRTNCSKTSTLTTIEIDWMLILKNQYDEALEKAIEKADCIFYVINKLNLKDTSKMLTDLVKISQRCTKNQKIEILWLHNSDDTERFSVYEFLVTKLMKCFSFREKFLDKNRWRMWSLDASCYSKFQFLLEWACYEAIKRKVEHEEEFLINTLEEIAILSEYIQCDRGL
ncbi:unnamed protein product [Rodentolepis nana]|uniref:TIR domain-containing protein n=1 Tax=Rodentolepis nana TaxID=102285 RepID=A0A0R3T0N5_RODNA|nr:unnamed protein product [Rodentolepis nana]